MKLRYSNVRYSVSTECIQSSPRRLDPYPLPYDRTTIQRFSGAYKFSAAADWSDSPGWIWKEGWGFWRVKGERILCIEVDTEERRKEGRKKRDKKGRRNVGRAERVRKAKRGRRKEQEEEETRAKKDTRVTRPDEKCQRLQERRLRRRNVVVGVLPFSLSVSRISAGGFEPLSRARRRRGCRRNEGRNKPWKRDETRWKCNKPAWRTPTWFLERATRLQSENWQGVKRRKSDLSGAASDTSSGRTTLLFDKCHTAPWIQQNRWIIVVVVVVVSRVLHVASIASVQMHSKLILTI